jgi:hypothetical protein
VQAAVLRGEVVPVFAVVAGEDDFIARHVLARMADGGWRKADTASSPSDLHSSSQFSVSGQPTSNG